MGFNSGFKGLAASKEDADEEFCEYRNGPSG